MNRHLLGTDELRNLAHVLELAQRRGNHGRRLRPRHDELIGMKAQPHAERTSSYTRSAQRLAHASACFGLERPADGGVRVERQHAGLHAKCSDPLIGAPLDRPRECVRVVQRELVEKP